MIALVKYHESDRGKNLLFLERYMGQLYLLQEEMKKFVDYPRGTIITKVTRRVYRSKTKGVREYANFYDNLDVDGKQFHISKNKKQYAEKEMREKYGEYDPNDYNIKENLPGIRDKLKYKKYIEESAEKLRKLTKEIRNRLNFGKCRQEKELTKEEAESLGRKYRDGMSYTEMRREEKMRKTMIARYGTKEQIAQEFNNAGQMAFYLCDGKMIETKRGEPVRSRAELLVAEILNALEVPYVYEYYVREAGLSCDFLIYLGGEKYYLEVLGMMDQEEYRRRWKEKTKLYYMHGIKAGKNLVVLDLTERDYLDVKWIEAIICGLALGNVPAEAVYGVKDIKKAKRLKKRAETQKIK